MQTFSTIPPSSLLLFGAIGAVWGRPVKLTPDRSVARWVALAIIALLIATLDGIVQASAWPALIALGLATWAYRHAEQAWQRGLAGLCTVLLALALALHKLPGFHNPLLLKAVMVSPDGLPFTQYANFDKASVGLVLLALVCQRIGTLAELRAAIRSAAPVALLTVSAVMAVALASGIVRTDLKWPDYALKFVVVNLLFTVIAEEAFFRGLLQGQLVVWFKRWRYGSLLAVACSALLFGAEHLAGGAAYAGLAALAGLGYAYAYHASGRIEAAIATHLLVNTVHFIGFTYPALA